MFGFFKARPPLNLREKTWVELRMQWLAERLGFDKLQACEVITPSDAHFPDAYSGSDENIERIFARICDLMGVRNETLELVLFDGAEPPPDDPGRSTALGMYRRNDDRAQSTIWIARSQAAEPTQLVATIAHELSHHVLLGEGFLGDTDADHEFVTDLLPVVRGLGIFVANAAVAESVENTPLWSRWSISKRGYLPARMLGYALGVFAWLRGEQNPEWAAYLRGDAREVMPAGLKYLRATGDCRCQHPSRDGEPRSLLTRLTSANPGTRVAALWELRRPQTGELAEDEWAGVAGCLDHHDSILQCEAALAIAAIDRPDRLVADKCLDVLASSSEDSVLRAALALALGTQRDPSETAIYDVTILLDDNSERVVAAALGALRRFGPVAAPVALAKIIEVFQQALVECNSTVLINAVAALRAIHGSPADGAIKNVKGELRKQAVDALLMEIDEEMLVTARLPTPASLPVPLPDWRPSATRVHIQHIPHNVR